jgi:tripartite-type tricarboxylate transporter receptor subunit TctC
MDRKDFLITGLLGLAGLAARASDSGSFPDRAITLIVPFPAGGGTDNAARAAARSMSKVLGAPVVVDNRPGAGGNIAVSAVARANPDGYTLLLGHISQIVINPHTYRSMPADPLRDLKPIGLISSSPMLLVVHPSLPVHNLQEFIAYAKKQPEALNYASAGTGGITHLAMELLASQANIRMTHVPYKGGAPALQDLLAGRVHATNDALPQLLQHVKQGKLRAIATTGMERSEYIPDVPTMAESGLPNYAMRGWLGVFAPSAVPAPVVQKVKDALDSAVSSKEYVDFLRAASSPPLKPISLPDFAEFVRTEHRRWGEVVRLAGVEPS